METCASRFTAAEGGSRLAATAATKNILAVEYSTFIPVRLLYEKAYQIRGSLFEGSERSVYIARATRVPVLAYELNILTDLHVASAVNFDDVYDWTAEMDKKEVLICTSDVFKQVLEEQVLTMANINVLIIDSCHLIYRDDSLKYIMQLYKQCPEADRPIILALTYPPFSAIKKEDTTDKPTKPETMEHGAETIEPSPETKESEEENSDANKQLMLIGGDIDLEKSKREIARLEEVQQVREIGVYHNLDDFDMYEKLEWKIEELEKELCCQMDLAEDIDGGKRISSSSTKPRELIVEYMSRPSDETVSEEYKDLEKYMLDAVHQAMQFIHDHRHDPTEIYGEELYEEFMNIPDPAIEPTQIFKQFLYVLEQLGPYAADKAAFSLLTKLEKLKIKVPYERHFLLLCLCTTVFVKIRCYADSIFSQYENDWEKIKIFCTPKVLRFAEILEKFKPPDIKSEGNEQNSEKIGKSEQNTEPNDQSINVSEQNSSSNEKNEQNQDSNKNVTINRSESINKMLSAIENCNFTSLVNKIQDKVNTYECNLKEIYDLPADLDENINVEAINTEDMEKIGEIIEKIDEKVEKIDEMVEDVDEKDEEIDENVEKIDEEVERIDEKVEKIDKEVERVDQNVKNDGVVKPKEMMGFQRRTGPRIRGTRRQQRTNVARALQLQQNPDALCAIVYMKEPLIANIMFMLVVDMSRANPNLSYLCAQYCATQNSMDPCTELKECQKQAKKQEEVLKKFRMHECNLLLATSALEEGIDLPRCNLVLRWDIPPSYRSYGVCRGRARAARAAAGLLCSDNQDTTNTLLEYVATYRELDQIVSRKCGCGIQDEPPQCDEDYADVYTSFIKPYTPNDLLKNSEEKGTERDRDKDEKGAKRDTDEKENGVEADERRCDCKVNDKHHNHGLVNNQLDEIKADCGLVNNDLHVNSQINNDKCKDMYNSRNDQRTGIRVNEDLTVNNDHNRLTDLNKVISNISEINLYDKDDKTNEHTNVTDIAQEFNDIMPVIEQFKSIDIKNQETDKNSEINDENIKNINENAKANDNSIVSDDKVKNNADIRDQNLKNYDESNKINEGNDDTFKNKYKSNKKPQVDDELFKENDKIEQESNKNDLLKDISQIGDEIIKENYKIEQESLNINEITDKNVKSSNKSDIKQNLCCNKCNIVKDKCVCVVNNIVLSDSSNIASVDLSTAIALINRYCGKLPSDTFTRLAPQWWMEEAQLPIPGFQETRTAYICTLRLPLNCSVKYNIVGHPMPTKVLARRMVALQACRILHKSGELDDQLMPIGKENFKAAELEACNNITCPTGNVSTDNSDSARPGTTKRRQYYYKRTAWAFTDCQPVEDTSDSEITSTNDAPKIDPSPKTKPAGTKRNMLYAVVSKLWCALPERYNTRGRRLHAPQNASQAIGILMAREQPVDLKIPAFPVYTRSGEVRVSVEHVPDADVRMSPRRGRLVRRFMRFVFSEVLRVRRRGMKLQNEGSTHNNYYIVPTIKTTREDGSPKIDIDWSFLELIYQHTEEQKLLELEKPILFQQETKKEKETERDKDKCVSRMGNPLLKEGESFVFDAEKYREAVVTPWYRNRDQPQFFLVAEICWNLSPDSAFPSAAHSSFREYYTNKYNVTLSQADQPLLDVDHTSARLNLLTPRYVNRKGVALPVSSERTRRAKRDRLDQKQILVPELCRVHPFAAPLWFATVALPCVLYRINALLIADEIRRAVAIDVGLGIPKINENTGFQWPPLDFGWSLAEVLSADSEKNEKKKEEEDSKREQKELRDKEPKQNKEDELSPDTEVIKKKTINDILQEKEDAEAGFEIGTWSNDMASSIPDPMEYDEFMEPLPPNLTFCTSASGGANWCDPIEKPKFSQFNPSKTFSMADSDCSYMSSDLDSDDSDLDYDGTDEDTDISWFSSSKNANAAMGVRIEYKTAHEAEAVDVERNKKVHPAPLADEADDERDREIYTQIIREGRAPEEHIDKFRSSVLQHKQDLISKGHLITQQETITEILPESKDHNHHTKKPNISYDTAIRDLFPYGSEQLIVREGQVDIESIEKNKRVILEGLKRRLSKESVKKLNCFSMKDINIDSKEYVNEKVVNVGFDKKEQYHERCNNRAPYPPYYLEGRQNKQFDFDQQPTLEGHPGPSPSVILQALTMSNANDGINLERLETIGDSFLKFAITAYLYCAHPTVHEGKLSHMRSKQVSNLNLYRLGRNKCLGARMIASKFEPHDNWLPPCHKPPPTLHPKAEGQDPALNPEVPTDASGCFIPYNLITQHSIPDKSIADCVEALIGAYLLECGPRGALLFMSWLGIRVLPCHLVALDDDHVFVTRQTLQRKPPTPVSPKRSRTVSASSDCSSSDEEPTPPQDMFPTDDWSWPGRAVGSLQPYKDDKGKWVQPVFGELKAPPSPLLRYIEDPEGELEQMLSGYDELERTLQYRFNDRSLLLQALTHASHHTNRLTDCYQRLEFLGDAILDYLITRHLYEDPRRHSPGALTDLRSALVNNTIFATLAARHGFHKYFRHMSPGLNEVLTKYVKIQEENGHSISEEHYLIQEDEMEQAEDVEVPKALGDLFESVAGAVFLDSGMSLGAVWRAYVSLMGTELEAFSAAAPKSPVRELLEAEPDTAKFGKPERLADGRRVRVCVEVFGRGTFKGVGRNYRIAKGTAARCALRHLRASKPR